MIDVYVIRCRINGKVYIGQTKCGIKKRWTQHVYASKCEWRRQYSAISRAIAKYGPESFSISALISGIKTPEEANAVEIRMIAQCCATDKYFGYNLHPGGSYMRNTGHKGKWGDLVTDKKKRDPESMPSFPSHLKLKLPERAHPEHYLMRAGKVAEQLDVKISTLRRWCEEGMIKGVISGKASIWLNASSVQRFIEDRKAIPRSEAA